MGRETKFLLAVLGILVGAFVGVLSMKLLVPRPPAGAGPDVEPHHLPTVSQDIVDPPALEPRGRASAFTAKSDPFLARAEFREPADQTPPGGEPSASVEVPDELATEDVPPALPKPPTADTSSGEELGTPSPRRVFEAPATLPGPPPAPHDAVMSAAPRTPLTGIHTTVAGDTWWSIAERAYGDGRLYRALYAWNRRLDPRVSVAPGTRLEIPPQPKLAAAWPKLMP